MFRGMGAYDNTRREASYGREPRLDDGAGVGGLSDRFSALGVRDSSREHLFQVMKAVEAAESIINQQLEENNQLRDELLRKARELDKYKSGATSVRPSANALRDEDAMGPYRSPPSNSPAGNEADTTRWGENGSSINPPRTLIIHQSGILPTDGPSLRSSTGGQQNFEHSRLNGTVKGFTGAQAGIDSAGPSQFSSPSSRSLSPSRHQKDGEYDQRFNLPKDALMPVSEINSNIRRKQDLAIKVREHEEEITQLRKHLVEYSIKEAQICNEKYVLEKRIAYMRMAFDQQQQDLVDAASKALSYRQEIIEENIRLTYALQAAQQERSTFIASLLPLLSEYSLQPPVLDAQSIVSNLKVLFKHLQEKLIITEDKLKESQYQLTPWHAETLNNASFPSQSPSHPLGAALATSNKNNLEIVPQQAYAHGQSPVSSPSNAQTRVDWEPSANQNRYTAPSGVPVKNLDHDALERNSPSVSRNSMAPETLARANQGDTHVVQFNLESKNQNLSFTDLVRGNEAEDAEAAGLQHGKDAAVPWGVGSSQYMGSGFDDPNSYPHLPPVLEEPGSSFSEAADDDPLPAIDGLQITGDAFPGRELLACGHSINGTTSCNFEWVRYFEDGSVNYIEGAKQPSYLVTADDVDSYLAIEVYPLDDRKRKGELVKVFANDQRKITCDPNTQEQIERTLSVGHVSFEVLAFVSDKWERTILAIKREGYSIKCNGPSGFVATQKFLPTTAITIPYGDVLAFVIHFAGSGEYLLRTADSSWSRDAIVRTMRLFKNRAVEKRKGKKRGLFFK